MINSLNKILFYVFYSKKERKVKILERFQQKLQKIPKAFLLNYTISTIVDIMYVILKARDTIDGGYMYIIIKLKEIREQKNLSLGDLAQKTGISKSHLNYIEKGEKEPSLSMIIRIAIALNIDEKELYKVVKWFIKTFQSKLKN